MGITGPGYVFMGISYGLEVGLYLGVTLRTYVILNRPSVPRSLADVIM